MKALPITEVDALRNHFVDVIKRMQFDLMMGARPTLAAAFALTSLHNFKMATTPHQSSLHEQRLEMRMVQALQIAVRYYEEPAVIVHLGEAEAQALRLEFLDLIAQFTRM